MNRAFLLNTFIGEYRLVDFLGAGGMGEVYRAVHSKLGRVAAIKVLTQAAHSGGDAQRFFNEARIQASLQHPNIATLYDFLEFQGQPCIVMEYVDGDTLADRIRPSGSLPPAEALRVFQSIVEAIDYIHRHGIIHRDIKSHNVKVSSAGQVKLLDFGIAKGETSQDLTTVGSIIGTLNYIPPEQLRGVVADARSDIWALGVLLYEMVTGHVPFESTTLGDLCDKITNVVYTPPTLVNSSVPRHVESIITRCLKKSPADRYQSAQELLQDIKQPPPQPQHSSSQPVVLPTPAVAVQPPTVQPPPVYRPISGSHSAPTPITPPTEETSWAKKNWLLLAGGSAAAAVVLLFVVGAGLLWMMSDGDDGNSNRNNDVPGVAAKAGEKPAQLYQANAATVKAASKTVRIDMSDGRAAVYRDGQMVGATPYSLQGRIGERVNLTLKREGYPDRPVTIDITENKSVYTYTLHK
ncbi:MAG: serine/threonine-protein kinase [Pyrinomonadaceae bacterium]